MSYNVFNCNADQLMETLLLGYRTSIPVLIIGEPGIGKTDIVYQFAERINAKMPDPLILSTLQAEDIRGVGVPNPETGRLKFYQLNFYPPSDSEEAWVMFYDELTNADKRLQAPLQQLLLHRKVGDYTLPQGAYQVAAGNGVDDECYAYEMSRALEDRFMIVRLMVGIDPWMNWALANDVNPDLIAFLKVYPEYLHYSLMREKHKGSSEDRVLPTPRAWGRNVDRVLKDATASRTVKEIALSGLVGNQIASYFFSTVDALKNRPSPAAILAAVKRNPKEAVKMTPTSLAGMWSLSFSLLAHLQTIEHLELVSKYYAELVLDDSRSTGEIVSLMAVKMSEKSRYELKIPSADVTRAMKPVVDYFNKGTSALLAEVIRR